MSDRLKQLRRLVTGVQALSGTTYDSPDDERGLWEKIANAFEDLAGISNSGPHDYPALVRRTAIAAETYAGATPGTASDEMGLLKRIADAVDVSPATSLTDYNGLIERICVGVEEGANPAELDPVTWEAFGHQESTTDASTYTTAFDTLAGEIAALAATGDVYLAIAIAGRRAGAIDITSLTVLGQTSAAVAGASQACNSDANSSVTRLAWRTVTIPKGASAGGISLVFDQTSLRASLAFAASRVPFDVAAVAATATDITSDTLAASTLDPEDDDAIVAAAAAAISSGTGVAGAWTGATEQNDQVSETQWTSLAAVDGLAQETNRTLQCVLSGTGLNAVDKGMIGLLCRRAA